MFILNGIVIARLSVLEFDGIVVDSQKMANIQSAITYDQDFASLSLIAKRTGMLMDAWSKTIEKK